MLKRLLYTISAFALAGGLSAVNPAVADTAVQYSTPYAAAPTAERYPAERFAYYDPELNCWLAEAPMGPSPDNPEPNEPEARYDSAKECVAYGRTPELARDYDPQAPVPQPGG